MDGGSVTLIYTENPLFVQTGYDPQLDEISFVKHGAKVLRDEYKSRLDLDIDFDLPLTEITCENAQGEMFTKFPARSRFRSRPITLRFCTTEEQLTPLADKIKEGNALRLIYEEEQEKKKPKNKKSKGKSKSPASANSALPRSPLVPTEPMPSPTSPKGVEGKQSSAPLLSPSSLPVVSDSMPSSTPVPNDMVAFWAILDERVGQLTANFRLEQKELEKKVEDLQRDNAELKRDNVELKRDNVELKRDNVELKRTVTKLEGQLQAHARILYPLHRRVVLDTARDKIIRDYKGNINPDILYPSASILQTRAIVDEIYKVLHDKDKALLSRRAVEVIISTGQGTIRGDGNAAAHMASETQMSDATLASSLSPTQRSIMNSVYEYAYGNVPTLGF